MQEPEQAPNQVEMDGVKAQIRRFISDRLGLAATLPWADGPLVSSDLVDSTTVVELAAFLESTFGIEVRDEDLTLENLDSMSAIAAFVERKRAAAGRASAVPSA